MKFFDVLRLLLHFCELINCQLLIVWIQQFLNVTTSTSNFICPARLDNFFNHITNFKRHYIGEKNQHFFQTPFKVCFVKFLSKIVQCISRHLEYRVVYKLFNKELHADAQTITSCSKLWMFWWVPWSIGCIWCVKLQLSRVGRT